MRPGQCGDGATSAAKVSRRPTGGGVATWRRRHEAARRLPALDCGCADPWPCRCTTPPLSEQRIDAGRDAAIHILNAGYVPVVEIEVLQALWCRGGVERELAETLFAVAGGQIA